MKPDTLLIYISVLFNLLLTGCENGQKPLTNDQFRELMNKVATGWSIQNATLALEAFDADAIYMEPPNIQYYRGHKQLRPYFDALDSRYKICLLYTSPSPRDGLLSRMPSSA